MTRPRTIKELAAALTLSEKALDQRRRILRMENPKDVEARLMRWLEVAWEERRDKVNRMGKGSGYVEFWSAAMGASSRSQLGNLHQEPEAVPKDEIGDYRESQQAKARYEAERCERTDELLGAIQQVKGAVYGLDPDLKKKISRELWVLKGRIDVVERKLKRDRAA